MVFRRQSSFSVAERATIVSPDLQEDTIISISNISRKIWCDFISDVFMVNEGIYTHANIYDIFE